MTLNTQGCRHVDTPITPLTLPWILLMTALHIHRCSAKSSPTTPICPSQWTTDESTDISPPLTPLHPCGWDPPKMVSPIASSAPHGIIGHRMRDITFSQTLLAAILDLGPALAKLEPFILLCVLLYAHACFFFFISIIIIVYLFNPKQIIDLNHQRWLPSLISPLRLFWAAMYSFDLKSLFNF